jgi:chromosome segregation ATPase
MPGYGYRGRYSSGGPDEEERRGFAKVVFSRFWFLIIPLIGLVYANARQVTPVLKDMNQKAKEEKTAMEKERTQTLTRANPIRAHISALGALGDTFQVRFAKLDSVTANLSTFLEADHKATARLHTEIDSLAQIYTFASSEASALADTLKGLAPVVDSLQQTIASRREQSQQLWAQTTQNLDLTDRILNPDKYKKRSALVPGEGEYPNRDELPKR